MVELRDSSSFIQQTNKKKKRTTKRKEISASQDKPSQVRRKQTKTIWSSSVTLSLKVVQVLSTPNESEPKLIMFAWTRAVLHHFSMHQIIDPTNQMHHAWDSSTSLAVF